MLNKNQRNLVHASRGAQSVTDFTEDSTNSTENRTPFAIAKSASAVEYDSQPPIGHTPQIDDEAESPPAIHLNNEESPSPEITNKQPGLTLSIVNTTFRRPSATPSNESGQQPLAGFEPLKEPGTTRAPASLAVSNSISSLIKAKSNSSSSRLGKLRNALQLEQSREDLIAELSFKAKENFDESLNNNFSSKYFYYDSDKLGEGAHASVYKCYLLKDRDVVDEHYKNLKELGFDQNEQPHSAIDIFARADDRYSLDRIEEEDEMSTATPLFRDRGVSQEESKLMESLPEV